REQKEDDDAEQHVEANRCARAHRERVAALAEVHADETDADAVNQHDGNEQHAAEKQIGKGDDRRERQHAGETVDVGRRVHWIASSAGGTFMMTIVTSSSKCSAPAKRRSSARMCATSTSGSSLRFAASIRPRRSMPKSSPAPLRASVMPSV